MGIELIVAGLTAITSAIGGIAQANAAKKAAAAQKESNEIQAAETQVQHTQSRRERIREARIRRAQIIAASENAGTSQSSGEVGAGNALTTNLGSMLGTSRGQSRSASGMNSNLQRAADYTAQSNAIGAWTNVATGALGGFQTIFDKKS